MVDINKVDFEYYLPIFADALDEPDFPFDILARDGTIEMLHVAKDRVLNVLPEVICGMKKALRTENTKILMNVCAVLQKLATVSPLVSLALIRYYSTLLVPVFNKFRRMRNNLQRGEIHYGQRRCNVSDIIDQTLVLLEKTAGLPAYVEIKYAVPTYDSVHHNA
ncbi:parkin coregulated gene protein homolog [Caerostris darwini]|uniref:Parkin coregulated gene protein homolog n=1 Tax=Caerostris darwini TaxID=1538125 RepID=A0AAV4V287_9ARAC|nr:parkin coregulated gene protein homolog [Caerostris darwini]